MDVTETPGTLEEAWTMVKAELELLSKLCHFRPDELNHRVWMLNIRVRSWSHLDAQVLPPPPPPVELARAPTVLWLRTLTARSRKPHKWHKQNKQLFTYSPFQYRTACYMYLHTTSNSILERVETYGEPPPGEVCQTCLLGPYHKYRRSLLPEYEQP